jgi:hypothetical protein
MSIDSSEERDGKESLLPLRAQARQVFGIFSLISVDISGSGDLYCRRRCGFNGYFSHSFFCQLRHVFYIFIDNRKKCTSGWMRTAEIRPTVKINKSCLSIRAQKENKQLKLNK